MNCDLTYVLTAALGLTIGIALGFLWGARTQYRRFLHAALKAKNPELWDLLHYLVVDEEERKNKN